MPARERPPTLIFNPTAGAGRARRRWAKVEGELMSWPVPPTVVETEGPGHASELAASALRAGSPMVVVAGGDGTAHEAVQGVLAAGEGAAETVFAYLPMGTGCDFATSLGLRRGVAELARRLPGGRNLRIDIGIVEPAGGEGRRRRYFLNAANVGLGPMVAERVRASRWLQRWGTPAYLLATTLALLRARPQRISWRTDDGDAGEEPLLNLSVCNGPSFGGGMRPCPDATLTSGRLHVATVGPMGLIAAYLQMPRLMGGRPMRHPAIRRFTCSTLELEGPSSGVETDGEVRGELPVRLSVRPGGLLVRVPE